MLTLTMDEKYLIYSFNTKCGEIFVSDCKTKFINICLFCNETYLSNAEFTEHFQNTHFEKQVNSSDNYDITIQSIDTSLTDFIEEVPVSCERSDEAESDTEHVYEELNESEPETLDDLEADSNISKNAFESINLESDFNDENYDGENSVGSKIIDPIEKFTEKQFKISISRPFIKALLNKYKNLPILWDQSNTDYYSKNKDNAFAELIRIYKKFDLDVDKEVVQRKLQCLRTSFRRELIYKSSVEAKGKKHIPKLKYFKEMNFLLGADDKNNDETEDSYGDGVKTQEKMYHCDRCSRTFATECRFKYHQMSHENIFSCDICNNQYESLVDLLRHKKIHGLEMEYECETCGKKFSRNNTLRLHSYTHLKNDEKPFECDYCGSKFATKGNYLVHVKRHESITKFKCDICSKGFVTSTELRAHSFTHKTVKQYICELCGKDFKQKICFQNHIRKIHGTAEPQYKCNLCDKLYYTSKTLNKHKAAHNKERKHICSTCGAKFHNKYNYTLHMRSHMTVKMFICEFCQKGFNQASVLRNHIKKKHD